MKTTQTKQNKNYHLIYTDDWKADDDMMRDWWKEYMELNADGITEDDLIRELNLDKGKITDKERQALATLLPLYKETQMESEPNLEYWHDEVNNWLECDLDNLDKEVNGYIVGMSDAGLWNGRRQGCGLIGYNIKNFIDSICCDDGYLDIWANKDGLHASLAHHDGTNYYLFRIAKDYDTAQKLQYTILQMQYDGKSRDELETYFKRRTKSLFPDIASIYGWN